MTEQLSYPQDVSAMKEDIAERTRNLEIKKWAVTGLLAGGGLLAAFLVPAGAGALAPLLAVGGIIGGGIANVLFAKEIKKLELDEQFLEANLRGEVGRRYWEHYQGQAAQPGTPTPPISPGLQGVPSPTNDSRGTGI